MLQFIDLKQDKLLATVIDGKLSEEEIELLHAKIHEILETNNKLRWYFEMNDFDGWSAKGFWEDLKMDSKHASDYEKIAMVGDSEWQDWMTQLMKPFTNADIKFFEIEEKERAKKWIQL
ncbi:STAS/SEC14 domain-containing protein [Christiangramia forsetii]|uniref:STAS/SEC14 domain-containing protein n=2 Tax=Christiangramia forsetii TaxID=411153 RepID=A0LXC2_CHRFK|nr:STAS/SEC14 domain-containing protein [Christiangramia forsetii]GGG27609.1 hypothetical protein GCM10011532_08770 [Christiangramia forsetii]CAL65017.1 conserved hypothetical protein [Christiangramia forsetii KT0803]